MDRILGHRVGHLKGVAADRRTGRGVDHRPAAAFQHDRQGGLRCEQVALGVDREGAVEHFFRAVQRVNIALSPAGQIGMIEIEPTEFIKRSLDD